MLCALVAVPAFALDPNSLKPQGYLNDFAHVLDESSHDAIETYCGRLEQATGVQMAIVTVDSLGDQPIDDFANTLFRKWGIGHKTNEGLLLLLAVRDHKDRIEVGYGLEPTLPDGFVGGILRGIQPQLRAGDYRDALLSAAESMGSKIAAAKNVSLNFGLERPEPEQPVRGRGSSGIPWPLLIIGFLFLLALFGRHGRGGGGGGTGFLTGMLLGNLLGGGSSRWGGGGFGGFDSGGGGGGGGFGGFGGGDSGGGGASSGW